MKAIRYVGFAFFASFGVISSFAAAVPSLTVRDAEKTELCALSPEPCI